MDRNIAHFQSKGQRRGVVQAARGQWREALLSGQVMEGSSRAPQSHRLGHHYRTVDGQTLCHCTVVAHD